MFGRDTQAVKDARRVEQLNKSADVAERYRQEAVERRRQEAVEERARVEVRWAAEAKRQKDLDEARLASDRAAGTDIYKRRHAQHEAQQSAQRTWAEQRDQLQTDVASIRGLLSGASGLMVSGAIEEARTAAADVAIYTRRLAVAEAALAAHLRSQPRAFA